MSLTDTKVRAAWHGPGSSSRPELASRTNTLAAIPAPERQRIVSGMRWTVWFAALGAPFGYATSLILARVSPEALGTYGLLLFYVSVVSALFYFGGDAVVINFIPRLEPSEALSFMISYFVIIVGGLVPWWVAGSLWPHSLHYVFGDRGGLHLQLLLLYLAPVCILFSLLLAALKAELDMKWAQGLFRVVTVGFFLIYASLFITERRLLRAYYSQLIWTVYFSLIGLAIGLAVHRLRNSATWRSGWHHVRLFLPRGFWRYALPLQMSSAMSVIASRVDYILVLNFGGLRTLGKYVAAVMIVDLMRVLNQYLVDTLLPSLINLLTAQNLEGAEQIFAITLRMLYVANSAIGCALIFLVGPILKVLGPQYAGLATPMVMAACFATLAAPSTIAGTLLTSVGKQHRATWLSLARFGLSVGLFLLLWPHWGLLGAVLASGLALLVYSLALPVAAKFGVPITFRIAKDYVRFALVIVAAGAASQHFGPLGIGMAILLWLAAMGTFLGLAQYRYGECRELAGYLLPVGLDV